MESNTVTMLIVIVIYLLGMVAIGLYCSKKTKDVSDFYLGGRKLGPVVTAMSAEASDMSGWLLMGLPGVAYLCGVADAAWTGIGLAIGTYLNWLLVAKRLRLYSRTCGNAITIPDFISNRYRDKSKALTLISALIIIIFFVPYTASGFAACGKLFSTLFGIDYHIAMIVSAVIIISYTTIGGFLAASTTDLVQSVVMTFALLAIVGFGVNALGGVDAVFSGVKDNPGYLSFVETFNADTGMAEEYGPLKIISTLAWGLGYFGMPHILLRFMAIKDSNKIKVSRRIGTIWVCISLTIAIIIGIIGLGISRLGDIPALAGSDSETVIIQIATFISKYGIPAACLAGLILAGIFASTMSTSDSQLLAASSSLSEDILHRFFKIKMTKKVAVLIARVVLVVIAAVAVVIAWDSNSSVFTIVSFSWAGFGATFGPVMLAALFWKRSNKWGVFAGIVSGGVMVFVWKYLVRPLGGVWNLYELLPAFIVASVVIVAVSLLTKAPDKEIIDEFNLVKDMVKGRVPVPAETDEPKEEITVAE